MPRLDWQCILRDLILKIAEIDTNGGDKKSLGKFWENKNLLPFLVPSCRAENFPVKKMSCVKFEKGPNQIRITPQAL